MAIQSNFPAIKPTLLLDFANTKQLDPRVTFTRASTGTFYGTQTAKAEENLLLQSQDFTTFWDLTNGVTATANTTVAPDGTTTADTLAETATTSIHTSAQAVTSSGTVTLSVFAKLNSGTPFLTIGVNRDVSNYTSATFDLSAGTSTQTQAVGNYTSASATITAVAQGFYRCTLTVTTDSVATARVGLNNTGTPTASNRGFGATYLGVVTNSVFVWGAQLEQRSAVTAYTVTTTQPITNYIPVLQTAASGVARFEHNPITFESLGLEIEEQRTNLVTYSEQFNDAAWTKNNATITANTIVAPDGTLTGDNLVEDTTTAAHQVLQAFAGFTSGTAYTSTIYAKNAGRRYLRLTFAVATPFSAESGWIFDLETGTLFGSAIGSATATITAVGNGWYRCAITATATGTGTSSIIVRLFSGSSSTYTGNGYSGIFIWGAQLEAGAFPTSYIQTVASQVTRAADAASMTGTNFSSWYNQAEGSLYVESQRAAANTASGFPRVASVNDGTANNEIATLWSNTTNKLYGTVVSGGAIQADVGYTSQTQTSTYKTALAYRVNDFAFTANSAVVQTDAAGVVPVVSSLSIGNIVGVANLNGTIRKIAYYPLRVTNANLQALTS